MAIDCPTVYFTATTVLITLSFSPIRTCSLETESRTYSQSYTYSIRVILCFARVSIAHGRKGGKEGGKKDTPIKNRNWLPSTKKNECFSSP